MSMPQKHRDALSKALPVLCSDMLPEETAMELMAKGCFTQNMVDETKLLTMTKMMRNSKIVELVKSRGPLALYTFIDVLNATAQSDLVVQIHKHLPDDDGFNKLLKKLPSVAHDNLNNRE